MIIKTWTMAGFSDLIQFYTTCSIEIYKRKSQPW